MQLSKFSLFEGAVAVSQVSVIDWRRAVGQPLKLAV